MSKVDEEIRKAMDEFHKDILSGVDFRVHTFAMNLRNLAAAYRSSAPGSHDFTGNLLNSIVVCVYKEGNPDAAYFVTGLVKGSIRAKMTRSHGPYAFKVDYEGESSVYRIEDGERVAPEIETDQGRGIKDAQDFFAEYRPSNKEKYTIVVAYTTEYASYVESARHTTGFVDVYTDARKYGSKVLQLPRTYSYSVVEAPF